MYKFLLLSLFTSFASSAQMQTMIYQNNFSDHIEDTIVYTYQQFEKVNLNLTTASFDGSTYIRAKSVDNVIGLKIKKNWAVYDSVIWEMDLYLKSEYSYGFTLRTQFNSGKDLDSTYLPKEFGGFKANKKFKINISKYLNAQSIGMVFVHQFNSVSDFCYADNLKIIGYSNTILRLDDEFISHKKEIIKETDLQGREYNPE